MKLKRGISYNQIYNDVFSSKQPRVQMKHWIQRFYKKPVPRTLKHIKILVQTQRIVENFQEELTSELKKAQKFFRMREYFACKRIQKHVLSWLWKPGGRMFRRQVELLASFFDV